MVEADSLVIMYMPNCYQDAETKFTQPMKTLKDALTTEIMINENLVSSYNIQTNSIWKFLHYKSFPCNGFSFNGTTCEAGVVGH